MEFFYSLKIIFLIFSLFKRLLLTSLLFFLLFVITLITFKVSTVNAEQSINVTASVYSCDFKFQLRVKGNKDIVDYSTQAQIKFSSKSSQSFILNIPVDKDGKASANLCDNGLYLQGGEYTVELNVFESGYKSFKEPNLFKYYQTNLNIELNPKDLVSKKICNDSTTPILSSNKDKEPETISSSIMDSIFSKDKLMFGGLLFFVPIFGKKDKKNRYIRLKINLGFLNIPKIIKSLIKTYIESLKLSLLLIRSIIFTNG